MENLNVVEEILGSEKKDELEEALDRHEKPTKKEAHEIQGLESAISYMVDTLGEEEETFEPSTALIHYASKPSKNKHDSLETILSEKAFVDSILVDFNLDRKTSNLYSSETLEDGVLKHLQAIELAGSELDLGDSGEEALENYYESLVEVSKDYALLIEKAGEEGLDGFLSEGSEPSGLKEKVSRMYQEAGIAVPEYPDTLAEEMLAFFVNQRIKYAERTGIEVSECKEKSGRDREPQTYEDSCHVLDEEELPELHNPKKLVKRGAKYQVLNQDSDLDHDLLREFVKEARNSALDQNLETRNLEGKATKQGRKIYRELEKIAENGEDYLEEVVGAGAGSRDRLNTLIAEINYVAENCYKEKTVTKEVKT